MIKIKKVMCKMFIILLFIAVFGICTPKNYSMAWDNSSNRNVFEYAGNMKGNTGTGIDSDQLSNIIGRVVGTIQIIAGLFAVLTISFTGLQYVLCSTPDLKKELQRKMLPIIISLVFIFGAVSIARFIIAAFENV